MLQKQRKEGKIVSQDVLIILLIKYVSDFCLTPSVSWREATFRRDDEDVRVILDHHA
jgi:hypothetical protein